jgi:hypothetical protein
MHAQKAPHKSCDIGSIEYWDARYNGEGNRDTHEWYFPYKDVQRGIESFLKVTKSERVLVVGCGTSSLGADMLRSGFQDVTCVDFSSVAIRIMTQRQPKELVKPYVKCTFNICPCFISSFADLTMDVRDMAAFTDSSFDVILDKGIRKCKFSQARSNFLS